jgi:SAM-dependent methyltransferase
MIHLLLEKLKRRVGNRWFTLDSLPDRVNATRTNRILNSRAARKRFPIRGLRYWWIRCALLEEIERREGEVVIADIGCSRGHGKLFVGDLPKTRWVGLDLNMDRGVLRECGYSELHQCDFDKPLPLAENSVDIVVFSHVIEHLLRPELTVGELSRILRPGGVLIAGSPVAPSLIAKAHEWHLQRQLKAGRIKLGGHINSMSPKRWKRLLNALDMNVEMMTGTFLVRWSGNPLENHAWWVRLNQLWGALFPGWGGEIYLTARKPLHPQTQPAISTPSLNDGRLLSPKWAWGVATFLFCFGILAAHSLWIAQSCPIHVMVEEHQDGNDRFFLVTHPAIKDVREDADIEFINHYREIEAEHKQESVRGIDAHFLVPTDVLAELKDTMTRRGLHVIQEFEIGGDRFALLSSEIFGHGNRAKPHGSPSHTMQLQARTARFG